MTDIKRIFCLSLSLALIASSTAYAQDKAEIHKPKFKKASTAFLLAIDPIPGDALFYAGKKGQAWASTSIGLVGLGIFSVGLAGKIRLNREYKNQKHDLPDWHGFGEGLMMLLGVAVYGTGVAWDLIGGTVEGAKMDARRRKAEKKTISVRPYVTVNNKQKMIGINMTF